LVPMILPFLKYAGLLPAHPNWMRTMTLEQTASLRADVIKLNPLIAYNPPWRG
jgi:hypothetical protein